jgi:hypothetical protein
VISVGAVAYFNTPAFGNNTPTMASFSSLGGTSVNGSVRQKPDISSISAVTTTVKLSDNQDPDSPFFLFSGTSAAAPHVAAAAALIMESRQKYFGETTVSPAAVKSFITDNALDMGPSGFDFASGAGLLQLDRTLLSYANPKPVITEAIIPEGITAGEVAFELTIKGNYFLAGTDTRVMFGDQELPITSKTETEIKVQIQPYTGSPQLYVLNASKTVNGDGGESEKIRLNALRTNITITANDATRRYGESDPDFEATITGLPEGVTDESLGLPAAIKFRVADGSINSLSDVGAYVLMPGLTAEKQAELEELYTFSFVQGLLRVTPLPLEIVPNDMEIAYGDKLGDITYQYNLPAGIDSGIKSQIEAGIQTYYSDNLVNGVGLINRATGLINDAEGLINADVLINSSAMISAEALLNRAASLLNSEGESLAEELSTEALLLRAQGLINAQGLLNVMTFMNAATLMNADVLINALQNRAASLLNRATSLLNGLGLINGEPILNGIGIMNGAGLINGNGLINGEGLLNAETLLNGEPLLNRSLGLLNGEEGETAMVNSLPLLNGEPLLNGAPLLNSGDSNDGLRGTYFDNALIILSSLDAEPGKDLALKPINMITGFEAGDHYIIPGTFVSPKSKNFAISTKPGKLKINPKEITVKADDKTKGFGEDDPELTYKITNGSLLPGYQFGELTRKAGEDAGKYAIKSDSLKPGTNYDMTYEGAFLTIEQATAALSVEGGEFTYDGNAKLAKATTIPADLDGVTITYNGSATAPINAALYEVEAKLTNANYKAANATATLLIKKAKAELELSNLNQTYSGQQLSATVTVAPNTVSGVKVTYDGSETAPTNAGSYKVVASLTNDNYEAENATGTLEIKKATATLTLSDLKQTYNGTARSVTVTTDPANLPGVSVTYNGSPSAPTAAGTYVVVASLSNTNYEGNPKEGSLVIDPKAITVTANNLSIGCNESFEGKLTYSAPDAIAGDDLSVTYQVLGYTAGSSGSFTIVPSASNPNYTFAYVNGQLNVAGNSLQCPANITVTGTLRKKGDCGMEVTYAIPTLSSCTTGQPTLAGHTFIAQANGSTYFVSDAQMKPSEAVRRVAALGGHLLTVTSAAEYDVIVQNLKRPGQMLIGLNDLKTEGTFVWPTGDPVTYTNWKSAEPTSPTRNSDTGCKDEDYVVAFAGTDWKWVDISDCNDVFYIIEFAPVRTAGLASGSFFPSGVNTVEYTYTAPDGAETKCSFTVTVNCPTARIAFGEEEVEAKIAEMDVREPDMTVFPNPARNEVTISLKGVGQNAKLTLTDNLGREYLRRAVQPGASELKLDTSHPQYHEGTYYLMVQSDENKLIRRLVIQK